MSVVIRTGATATDADMLWNFQHYTTGDFLLNFCNQYFGMKYGRTITKLYRQYFYAYWNQKKSDLEGFDRPYIFHDLRYQRAVRQIAKVFFNPYDPDPLEDLSNEQLKNRTFRIVPRDNGTQSQIDAIIKGTQESAAKFEEVTHQADFMYKMLDDEKKLFFNDNLRVPAYFMLNLNRVLYNYCLAYQNPQPDRKKKHLSETYQAALLAQQVLQEAAHDEFSSWYDQERIFNVKNFVKEIKDTYMRCENLP